MEIIKVTKKFCTGGEIEGLLLLTVCTYMFCSVLRETHPPKGNWGGGRKCIPKRAFGKHVAYGQTG